VGSTRRRGAEGRVRASRKMLVWHIARRVGLVVYESPEGVFCLRDGLVRVGELAET